MSDDWLFMAAFVLGRVTRPDKPLRARLRRALIAEAGTVAGLCQQAAGRIVDEGLAAARQ